MGRKEQMGSDLRVRNLGGDGELDEMGCGGLSGAVRRGGEENSIGGVRIGHDRLHFEVCHRTLSGIHMAEFPWPDIQMCT